MIYPVVGPYSGASSPAQEFGHKFKITRWELITVNRWILSPVCYIGRVIRLSRHLRPSTFQAKSA